MGNEFFIPSDKSDGKGDHCNNNSALSCAYSNHFFIIRPINRTAKEIAAKLLKALSFFIGFKQPMKRL
jgi:hypothetical protein